MKVVPAAVIYSSFSLEGLQVFLKQCYLQVISTFNNMKALMLMEKYNNIPWSASLYLSKALH